eukprot:snap_masked-scaffold_21-processed-gene-5.88-mRNA-1 protein AED:1.00 eAED:1.00 QI:0/-1/0/0/-1/1/1/0/461
MYRRQIQQLPESGSGASVPVIVESDSHAPAKGIYTETSSPTLSPVITPSPTYSIKENFIPSAQVSPIYPNTVNNMRTTNCGYFCKIMLSTGLKLSIKRQPELLLINHRKWQTFFGLRNTLLNQIGRGSACIGGGKGKQLACRRRLAGDSGCDFDDLQLQPVQYDLNNYQECEKFYSNEVRDEIWILKPGGSFHGRGITVHDGKNEVRNRYGQCKAGYGKRGALIAQRYVKDPVLIEGYKFDLRTYLLIGSTNPLVVFYHDGFIRKAGTKFSLFDLGNANAHVTNDVGQKGEDHFWGFHQLEEYLNARPVNASSEVQYGSRVMEELRSQAKRVSVYLAQTAVTEPGFRKSSGKFQLFALDWMVEKDGNSVKAWLLEANGNPLLTHYPKIDLTPDIWTSMVDLVRLIQVKPESIEGSFSVANQWKYLGWNLIWNELEATQAETLYEACKVVQYGEEENIIFGF